MKLTYEKLGGGTTWWYVKELQPGSTYQMIDSEGNPDPIIVQTKSGSAVHFDGFDGLIIEDDAVFAVSLLSQNQKIKVGTDPILS